LASDNSPSGLFEFSLQAHMREVHKDALELSRFVDFEIQLGSSLQVVNQTALRCKSHLIVLSCPANRSSLDTMTLDMLSNAPCSVLLVREVPTAPRRTSHLAVVYADCPDCYLSLGTFLKFGPKGNAVCTLTCIRNAKAFLSGARQISFEHLDTTDAMLTMMETSLTGLGMRVTSRTLDNIDTSRGFLDIDETEPPFIVMPASLAMDRSTATALPIFTQALASRANAILLAAPY
jgi:hypothetical protein